MADFSVALEKLQAALEVSEGVGTAPTRILGTGPPGNADVSGLLKRSTIEDRRAAGTRTSLRATYSGVETNEITFSNIPVSYQEVGFWLSLIAPSGSGAPGTVDTSAYSRTFTPVEGTAVNTYGAAGGYFTANLEYSTLDFASVLVYQMPAMRVSNIEFAWNKQASGTDTGMMMNITLMMSKGTTTAGTSFTGALSLTTPTLVTGNQVTATVDATYAGIGSTADTQITSATFGLSLPLTQHWGLDGVNGPTSSHYSQQWVPTLTMQRRFSDKTELNAYTARTTRAVQFEALGDVVGGTTAKNTFRFDAVVTPTDHTVTQVDGLYYADLTYEGIYDATMTTTWEVFLQNDLSTAYSAV